MACDKRQHRYAQRRDAWRPKWRAQRAHGFQSLPKRNPDTEYDTDGDANSQPDRHAKRYTTANSNT